MQSKLESDRRRARRARMEKWGGTFSNNTLFARLGLTQNFPFRVMDCSMTGMKIAAYRPLDRAERFLFKLPGTDGQETKVVGSVVWTELVQDRTERSGKSAWLGGVRFDPLNANLGGRLERHIERFREDAIRIKKPRVVRYYQKGGD